MAPHPGARYVPAGWWHCVINLEESIALTHNVVTEVNLLAAMDLLAEPAGCAPGRCGGDVMGDVPLWVAMGGSTTADPRADGGAGTAGDATPDGGCACDRIKAAMLARLEEGVERERPGLLARLRREAAAAEPAADRATLWDEMSAGSGGGAGFSFGF